MFQTETRVVADVPPPVRCVQCGRAEFRWRITVKATLMGLNEMLRVGWMPHQPCHAFDDVSTPVFDNTLAIDFPSHILRSV